MKENKDIKKEQSLDELMELASGSSDEMEEPTKRSPVKLIAITLVGLALVIALLIFATTRFSRTEVDNPQSNEGAAITTPEEVWDRMDFPVEVPRWARHPYNEEKFFADEHNEKEMYEWVQMTGFGHVAASLPSGIQTDDDVPPYTNDVTKAENEDGTFNEYYSYVLQEDYERAFALTVNRLLNPHFGGWATAQYTNSNEDVREFVTKDVFEDLFDPQWWIDNIDNGNADKMPIYADWDGDNYGGLEFAKDSGGANGRFFGIIDESEKPIEAIDLREDMTEVLSIKAVIPVKFVAYGTGDNLIEKKGELTLVLGPNANDKDPIHRVIAHEASLKINE